MSTEDLRTKALEWAAWCERRGMGGLEMFLRFTAPILAGKLTESQQVVELRTCLLKEKAAHQAERGRHKKLRGQMMKGEFYARDEVADLIVKFINEMSLRGACRLVWCKLIGRNPIKP